MAQQDNYRAFPRQLNDEVFEGDQGMSKRFYAACKAMEGIMASMSGGLSNPNKNAYNYIVKQAYALADEMIKQEDY